jgi:hypothetical protein
MWFYSITKVEKRKRRRRWCVGQLLIVTDAVALRELLFFGTPRYRSGPVDTSGSRRRFLTSIFHLIIFLVCVCVYFINDDSLLFHPRQCANVYESPRRDAHQDRRRPRWGTQFIHNHFGFLGFFKSYLIIKEGPRSIIHEFFLFLVRLLSSHLSWLPA